MKVHSVSGLEEDRQGSSTVGIDEMHRVFRIVKFEQEMGGSEETPVLGRATVATLGGQRSEPRNLCDEI